jgi:hypothetical protein
MECEKKKVREGRSKDIIMQRMHGMSIGTRAAKWESEKWIH